MLYTIKPEEPWNPQFHWIVDLAAAADEINAPHEDYPVRNDATSEIIFEYVSKLLLEPKLIITLDDIFTIHKYIMSTSGVLENGEIIYPLSDDNLGAYRSVTVRVGNHIPISPRFISAEMEKILPLEINVKDFNNISTIEKVLKAWYIEFETIHPFVDGNGRVGGAIVAIISKVLYKTAYLTPKRYAI